VKRLWVVLFLLLPFTAHAQQYIRITTCGTAAPPSGSSNGYMDATGNICMYSTAIPGPYTIVPLDISTVTTGGTAVTALNAGHRNKGGWLQNPKGATVDLCINEQGTASGTTSAGALTCIIPGNSYSLAPSGNAVSVVTSDSAHPFSGEGFN
jgi:hypothetical protein